MRGGNIEQLCGLCDHFCSNTRDCRANPGWTRHAYSFGYCRLASIDGHHINIMSPSMLTVETTDGNVTEVAKTDLLRHSRPSTLLADLQVIRSR